MIQLYLLWSGPPPVAHPRLSGYGALLLLVGKCWSVVPGPFGRRVFWVTCWGGGAGIACLWGGLLFCQAGDLICWRSGPPARVPEFSGLLGFR